MSAFRAFLGYFAQHLISGPTSSRALAPSGQVRHCFVRDPGSLSSDASVSFHYPSSLGGGDRFLRSLISSFPRHPPPAWLLSSSIPMKPYIKIPGSEILKVVSVFLIKIVLMQNPTITVLSSKPKQFISHREILSSFKYRINPVLALSMITHILMCSLNSC